MGLGPRFKGCRIRIGASVAAECKCRGCSRSDEPVTLSDDRTMQGNGKKLDKLSFLTTARELIATSPKLCSIEDLISEVEMYETPMPARMILQCYTSTPTRTHNPPDPAAMHKRP